MNKKIYLSGLFMSGLFILASCVDNNYDLDNIDTTSAIKVKDLIVPVNLETITLDQVFDIDDDPDNTITKFTYPDGTVVYAIKKEGSFDADPVFVDRINASEASIDALNIPVPSFLENQTFEIKDAITNYYYHISNVDSSVTGIKSLKMSEPMKINLQVESDGNAIDLDNVILSIPETFIAEYRGIDINGGMISVGSLKNGSLEEPIIVKQINFDDVDQTNGELNFEGEIGIVSATLSFNSTTATNLTARFTMSGFVVDQVSGSINYEIEAPEFESVSLDDLPDFLSESSTNLIISNPQIYLYFSNPVNAPVYSGLSIISEREWENSDYIINKSLEPFVNSLILAADINNLPLKSEYPNAVTQRVEELQNILAGNGLPSKINFALENTFVKGDIYDLQLGQDLSFYGNYTFFTPLALGAGSKIVYSDEEKDLFGDDVKDVKIESFQLTAYPKTNLPFAVILEASPLDKDGNVIKGSNGSEIKAYSSIPAYADGSSQLDLNFNESFKGLDGVKFSVTVDVQNDESLNPEQFIKLEKIRAKISGEYVTDF